MLFGLYLRKSMGRTCQGGKEGDKPTLRSFQSFRPYGNIVISESKILFKLIFSVQTSLCIFHSVCLFGSKQSRIIPTLFASSWHLSMKLQFWGHIRKPVWRSEEKQRFLLPTDIFLKKIRIPFTKILMLPPDDKIFSGELLEFPESIARSEVKLEWIRRSVIDDNFLLRVKWKRFRSRKDIWKVWCDNGGFVSQVSFFKLSTVFQSFSSHILHSCHFNHIPPHDQKHLWSTIESHQHIFRNSKISDTRK